MSAKWLFVVFVNTMRSVHFCFINIMVVQQLTALLKLTYIIHADLLK